MWRKIGFGAGFWAVMFLGISAFIAYNITGIWQGVGSVILAAVAGFLLARLYFKKSPGDSRTAVTVAIMWLVVATILDLLVTVQFVRGSGSYVDGLRALYSMWSLWVGFVALFVSVIMAAKMTHGGQVMAPGSMTMQPPRQPIQ